MISLSRRTMMTSTATALGAGSVLSVSGAARAAPPSGQRTILYGTELRVLGQPVRQVSGAPISIRGRLSDSRSGQPIGEFFAHGVVLAESRLLEGELGSLQTHLFVLADATLTGTGTVHHDGTGAFTVTGGSGRFAAARGTYSGLQSADYAGSGSAVFTFEIG